MSPAMAKRLLHTNIRTPSVASVLAYARIPPHFRKARCEAVNTERVQLRSIPPERCRVRTLFLLSLACCMALAGANAWALEITEPAKGAVVRPGAALKIKLAVRQGVPVARVTYSLVEEDGALDDR